MISLTVTLQVRPGHLDDFLEAITANAHDSFHHEPGCLRFDINQSLANPHRFVFYELYADAEALEAHRQAPHFATWRAAADAHVVPGSQINTVSELLLSHSD